MTEFESLKSGLPTLAVVVKDRTSSLTGSVEDEFMGLVESAGLRGVTKYNLNIKTIHPRHLIGKGQLDKIAELIQQSNIKQLVLNVDIDARHQNTISKYLELPVHDRTAIILDVFARRARTYEGKIQVEMAQIQYSSSRLVRGWTHLERQRGGQGLRGGPGEKQLELDKRLLRDQMKRLKKRFEKIKKQRNLSRSARRKAGFTTVSLVGYTSAGKSTLFNLLTSSDAQESEALFTTLDPTIRKVSGMDIGGTNSFLIADTVGFIESLSKDLMQSFAATFGEIHDSDLLLHVVDINDKGMERKQEAVEALLDNLDASKIPTIMVYNKVDMQKDISFPDVSYDDAGNPTAVWISATDKTNIKTLTKSINFFVDQFNTLPKEDYNDIDYDGDNDSIDYDEPQNEAQNNPHTTDHNAPREKAARLPATTEKI